MLALNSSALYLGIAGGSAIGSVVLMHSFVGTLAPTSAVLTTVSLAFFACSVWVSSRQAPETISDQAISDTRVNADSRAN